MNKNFIRYTIGDIGGDGHRAEEVFELEFEGNAKKCT